MKPHDGTGLEGPDLEEVAQLVGKPETESGVLPDDRGPAAGQELHERAIVANLAYH